MEITTNTTRWDIFRLSFHVVFTFKVYALIVLYIFIGISIDDLQDFSSKYIILIVLSVLGGGVAFLVGMVFALILIYLPKPLAPKGLGEHIFTINQQGLHERAPTNERIDKWSKIRSIEKSKNLIIIRVTSRYFFQFHYHLIPRRAFTTEVEFEEFFTRANEFWKEATK